MHHGGGGRSDGREWGQEKDKEEIKELENPQLHLGKEDSSVILLIAY